MPDNGPPHLDVYLAELHFQCSLAFRAWSELSGIDRIADPVGAWLRAQAILCACANVSKLLWSYQDEGRRGSQLRSVLGISEGSVWASRRLRNEFENFDERLDKWARKSEGRTFSLTVQGSAVDSPRRIDQDWTIYCLGRSVRLDQLAIESEILLHKVAGVMGA